MRSQGMIWKFNIFFIDVWYILHDFLYQIDTYFGMALPPNIEDYTEEHGPSPVVYVEPATYGQ